MLTIKSLNYCPNGQLNAISMTIDTADRAEVIHMPDGQMAVRLTWFAELNDRPTNTEHTIVMDSEARFGPATVYIENAAGNTVQRVSASVPYTDPNGLEAGSNGLPAGVYATQG